MTKQKTNQITKSNTEKTTLIKNFELPITTWQELENLANLDNRTLKNFCENELIKLSKNAKQNSNR